MKKYLFILLGLFGASGAFASASCQSTYSDWIKQHHKCLQIFKKTTAPQNQPKEGKFTPDWSEWESCYALERESYEDFSEGRACAGYVPQTLSSNFNKYKRACFSLKKDGCETLLAERAGKSIDFVRNAEGATLLMEAAMEANMSAFDYLLEKGAKISSIDNRGRNVLMYALEYEMPDQQKMVQKILDLGVSPNEMDQYGKSALGLAIEKGRPFPVIEKLLQAGANPALEIDVPIIENSKKSPLALAVESGKTDLAKVLLKYVASNVGPNYALLVAIDLQDLEMVKQFLKSGAKVNQPANGLQASEAYQELPICKESLYNGENGTSLKILQLLIKSGAKVNVNCREFTPLLLAVASNSLEKVKALVAAKADVNATADGNTVLEYAEIASTKEIVAFLKKAGAHRPFRGSFLQYCLDSDLTEAMVLEALQGGADVNETDTNGWTPLHAVALAGKNPKVMQLLIKKGAFVNAMTKSGYTPLLSAARRNSNPEMIRVLISAGADTEAKDSDGWDALGIAVAFNGPEVVAALLRAGLAENYDDRQKNLLVLKTVYNNDNEKTLIALMKAGYKAEPVNSWYEKPLEAAIKKRKKIDVIKVLLAAKAVVTDEMFSEAKNLPMDTEAERKYRNAVIDVLTKARKKQR
ncbi:ankyrin repeat domain-containing protein [uncultured Fibrobacter sp.]|uniref:ankyrin repeat domain-containing protein n=1 Tax=uncultured Fibrobacter sp. TaxID=261512 RepID=UPI002803AA29|nr:ankyrin repeat domain-containing protein [uncultured Fibrobacter sp.]